MAVEEFHSLWLSNSLALFFGWSLLSFFVRLWSKLQTKTWGRDDYAISAALITNIVHIAVTYKALGHGYGDALADIPKDAVRPMEVALFVSQLFYVIPMGLCRASTALYIAYMGYAGGRLGKANLLAGIAGAWTVASLILVVVRGDVSEPWATLDGTQPMYIRWMVVEIGGIALELVIWLLSVDLIWDLQMPVAKRLYVTGAFGIRLLLIPIIVYRLVCLAPANNTRPTATSILPAIITEAVLQFSIFSANIMSLRPFLRTFHTYYAASNTETSKLSRSTKNTEHSASRDRYYNLETLKPAVLAPTSDDCTWETYQSGPRESYATAYSQTQRSDSKLKRAIGLGSNKPVRNDANTANTEDSEAMIIRRTTDVSIGYDTPANNGSPQGGSMEIQGRAL